MIIQDDMIRFGGGKFFQFYDVKSRELVKQIPSLSEKILGIHGGNLFVLDGVVKIYDMKNGYKVQSVDNSVCSSAVLDDEYFVTGYDDGTIAVWNVVTLKFVFMLLLAFV